MWNQGKNYYEQNDQTENSFNMSKRWQKLCFVHRFYFNLIWFIFGLNRNDYISFRQLYNNWSLTGCGHNAQCILHVVQLYIARVKYYKNVKRSVFPNRFINEEVIHSHQTRRKAVNFFCIALVSFYSLTHTASAAALVVIVAVVVVVVVVVMMVTSK